MVVCFVGIGVYLAGECRQQDEDIEGARLVGGRTLQVDCSLAVYGGLDLLAQSPHRYSHHPTAMHRSI